VKYGEKIRLFSFLSVVFFCLVIWFRASEMAHAAAPDGAWWNNNYLIRQQITITAGAAAVPSGYSVSIAFNHASLVSGGKSLASGDDIRIVYWNGSGWTELDRALQEGSSWNNASTIVWFKTQAAISANTSNDNYYLYYRYPSATNPPANKSNIYSFWDDFNDGSLGAGWSLDAIGTVSGGSTSESGTDVTISATNTGENWGTTDNIYHLGRSVSGDLVAESDTTGTGGPHGTWSKYGGVHLRQSTAAGAKNAHMSQVYNAVGATFSYRLDTPGDTAETTSSNRYAYNRIIRQAGTARGYQSNDGVTWSQVGGTVTFTGGLTDPVRIGPMLGAMSTSPHSVNVDWFKIRAYVNPEPTTTLASAEAQFEYRRQITILDGMTPATCGGNLSNFTVVVDLSGTWLRTKANGGNIYDSNGYDIIFRSLDNTVCGGAAPCQLDHEIELYDGSATGGRLVAWIRIPTLYFNQDTIIYMYYGNAGITSQTVNPTGVWNTSYGWQGVWHLKESGNGTAGEFKDSTSNANHGQGGPGAYPTQTTSGKIGNGQDYNGAVYISAPNAASLQPTTAITLSGWIYLRTFGSGSDVDPVFRKGEANPNNYQLFIADPASVGNRTIGLLLNASDNDVFGTTLLSGNTWYYIVGTWSSGNQKIVYLNGVQDGTEAFTGPIGTDTRPLYIGGRTGSTDSIDGLLDEVRISNVARDACWIRTEYNNQNNPGTFVSLGAEQGPGVPTAVKLTSFTATEYSDGVLLRWRTGYEVDNLGFHVYREENGSLVRLTPEPVAGSALIAGSRTALTAGHHYHWWDASLSPRASSLKYWLEDIDLNGTHTMHGPVTPVFSREPIPDKQRPELLSEIGWRLNERYQQYWKVRELKEKLAQKPKAKVKVEAKGKVLRLSAAQFSVLSARNLKRRPQSSSLDNAVQQFLASRPAVKLFVREEGWYRVSQPELVAAGLSPRVDPRYLQLFAEGREQAIRVIGGKDGRFGPRDFIEFYGVGLDTPSTDTRVYWLVVGVKLGKRIQALKGYSSSLGSSSSGSFPYTVEKKDRTLYFAALRNGEGENFFGPVVYMNQVDQILELQHLDRSTTEEALLEVVLQGATESSHRVKVLLNESEVGETAFKGQGKGTLRVEISQFMLEEG
jgi:hypothetical protein